MQSDHDSLTTMVVTVMYNSHFSCFFQDVDECALDIDHCSDICTDEEGSYRCSCPDGFSLFEFNGYNDYSVAPGEDRSGGWRCVSDWPHVCQ